MLKWKKFTFGTIANNTELLSDMLAGAAGKGRVIKFITATIDDDIFIRVYRNNDQIVDYPCNLLTTSSPFLPMDLPLGEGELASIGFANVAAGSVTPTITIGYEETS